MTTSAKGGDLVEKIPLLVICGPTCSGKTAAGVELCRVFDGEVISADSMQIYKGLRISTAKPTAEEMKGIPHHLMDFLPPDGSFSVADFARLASEKARDISSRGKLPVVVGGTGLYISSLIDGVDFSHTATDPALRQQLENEAKVLGAEAMHERLKSLDPDAAEAIHPNNVIRVIRAIEMNMLSGRTMEENRRKSREVPSPYKVCMIGLTCSDRAVLYERINRRVDGMLAEGLTDEVRSVWEKYDTHTAFNAIGYKELIPYLEGKCSLDEAVDRIKQSTRNYAKRQLTWFRRDARIQWVYTDDYEHFDGILKKCINIVEKSEIV